MWVGNKSGEWLSSLPEDVSAAYHQDARKMVKEIKERTKNRRAEILELRKIRLTESKQKRLEEKEKKQQKKVCNCHENTSPWWPMDIKEDNRKKAK